MERKLRYLEKEIKKDGIPTMDSGELVEAPQPREMIDLEVLKQETNAFDINLFAKNQFFVLGNIRKVGEWTARS